MISNAAKWTFARKTYKIPRKYTIGMGLERLR
jgi:hypothetical protein